MVDQRVTWLAGVDGCKGPDDNKNGWIAVFCEGDLAKAKAEVFRDFEHLLADPRAAGVIAVDMPIGLPEEGIKGGRTAEREVRARIGKRRNSVFATPARSVVEAYRPDKAGYAAACAIARQSAWPAPSQQAYHIFPRMLQIDAALRGDRALAKRVFEVHPELSFALMNENEAPLDEPKKKKGRLNQPGMDLRHNLLIKKGFSADFLAKTPPEGAAQDDFFDACAAAWSAARIARDDALILPDVAECDSCGLPMRICG